MEEWRHRLAGPLCQSEVNAGYEEFIRDIDAVVIVTEYLE
jgi:hypothetical protein